MLLILRFISRVRSFPTPIVKLLLVGFFHKQNGNDENMLKIIIFVIFCSAVFTWLILQVPYFSTLNDKTTGLPWAIDGLKFYRNKGCQAQLVSVNPAVIDYTNYF